MTRKPGSGLHRPTSDAIEQMVGQAFLGAAALKKWRQRLETRGLVLNGVSFDDVESWLLTITDHIGLQVVKAESPAPDQLGDVRLILRTGEMIWIEVKAQTTKRFSELIQADWVRDETDTLRWLLHYDKTFRELSPPWVQDELGVSEVAKRWKGWDLSSLWLSDVGLISTAPMRAVARVLIPEQLGGFLARKYIIHLTGEGARVARLDSLRCAQDVLEGRRCHYIVFAGRQSSSIVHVSTSGVPAIGATDFVYYTGYNSGVLGRHKLTNRALSRSDNLFTVQAT